MKTIKLIGLMLAVMLTVLGFTGTVSAETYTVKKGDCLSKIGKEFQISWKVLARENGIKNPDRIYPNQKIEIPEEFSWEHAAANRYQGTPEEALNLLGYDETVRNLFVKEILNNNFTVAEIKNGDKIVAMTFGKKIVKKSVISRTGKTLAARLYTVTINNTEYRLLFPLVCGNWSRLDEEKLGRMSVTPPKVEEIPVVPTPPIVEEVPVVLTPQLTVPRVIPTFKKIQCRDFELTGAAGLLFGSKGGMKDVWGYGEGMVWDTCWYWSRGIGFYVNGDSGDVNSGYDWNSSGIGPQFGLRYQDMAVGDDGIVHPYGFTAKLRLVWTKMEGENAKSGYKMSQEDLLVGLYTEYVRQINAGLIVGVTFEGWISVMSNIDSSWSGDTSSNRGRVSLGVFVQKKLNEDWQARVGVGVFYQAWDEQFGLNAFGELRYDEWLMCGVTASFLSEGGVVAGPYCRAENGNKLRQQRDRKIVAGIWAVDENGQPIISLTEIQFETEEQLKSDIIQTENGSGAGYQNIENLQPSD